MRLLPAVFAAALFSCLVSALPAQTFGPVPTPSLKKNSPAGRAAYDKLLSDARHYAAENSWALARDAFAAARPLAPDADSARWCDLWLLDASWRAEPRENNDEQQRLLNAFDPLLAPYENNTRPRDDFWAACLDSRAAAKRLRPWQFRETNTPSSDELAIADYLANQSTTPDNAARYATYLSTLPARQHDYLPLTDAQREQLIQHLAQASRVAPDATARATLALAAATQAQEHLRSPERIDRFFADALTAARSTSLEPAARAHDFLRRAETGRLIPDKNRRPDLPVWLRELDAIVTAIDLAALSGSANTRASAAPVRTRLSELKTRWTERRLEIDFPNLFRPEDPIRFTVGCAYVTKLSYEIHRVTPARWPWFRESASKNKNAPPTFTPDLLVNWSADLSTSALHHWQSRIETSPTPLAPGLYALVIRDDTGVRQLRHFIVSAIAATALHVHDRTWDFFCFDSKTLVPQPAKSVQLWTFASSSDLTDGPLATTTDDHGRLTATLPIPTNTRPDVCLLIDGAHPVLLERLESDNYRGGDDAALQLDAFLPRELYRPGETVQWKLFARERRAGHFVKPTGTLTLKISIDDTPLCEPREVTWDDTGSASGELVIPPATRPGHASLELLSGGNQAAHIDFFTVDNFLPPPALATLDLASEVTSLRPSGQAIFRINARYFSGGPIIGAPVEFAINAMSPFVHSDESGTRAIRDAWQKELTARTLSAVTDADGNATCSLSLPDFLPDAFVISIRYSVKPSGFAEISGNKLLPGTASGLRLELDEKSIPPVVRPGEPVTIRFRYLDPLDRPAPVTGEVSLLENRWEEVWLNPAGQPVTGPALAAARREHALAPGADLPSTWKKIHAETATTLIATEDPVTASDGWGTVTFAAPHAGHFHLQFNAATGTVSPKADLWDFPRLHTKRIAPFYAADDTTLTLSIPPADSVLVPPAQITAGEKPRFFIVLPEGTTTAFLALTGETETRTQPLTPDGRVAFVTFENPPAFSAAGSACLIFPHSPDTYDDELKRFAVLHPETHLTTEIAPTVTELRPGAPGEAIIRTRDSDQRPRSADVAFAISDQAVNHLHSTDANLAAKFLTYARIKYTRATTSLRWEKRPLSAHFHDPRPGLHTYETSLLTEAGDVIQLSQFSVEGGRFGGYAASSTAGGSLRLHGIIAADSFGSIAEENTGEFITQTADLTSPARPDPSSTVLGQSAPPKPTITLRRHFASTAFWAPSVKTDANGEARVTFNYPDNLTEWRLAAYATGADGNTFGTATTFTRTSLPFQARLQTPRFLIAGDTADLSATFVNRSTSDVSASAELQLTGTPLTFTSANDSTRTNLAIPRENETRTAWSVRATEPGNATLTLTARTATDGDAMQLPLPVHEDGIQQSTAASARLATGARSSRFTLELPSPLDPARTDVVLQLSLSRAATVLDALPYVIDYPYGCVEQTMSRFLPAVVVKQTLADLGLDPAALEKRILARPNHRATQPRNTAPAFTKLDDVVAQSLARLTAAQSHNGFGWWPDAPEPDLWMTAYIAWGLALAEDAGIDLPKDLASETNDALEKLLAANPPANDTTAWGLAAIARAVGKDAATELGKTFDRVFASRDTLSAYGRASLLLASTHLGEPAQRDILLRNLENGATRKRSSDFGDTVHWGKTADFWRATDSSVETTALTLLALLETTPQHPLIEPAVNWLVLNRRSAHWTNTRDTAFAILALTRYLAISKEAAPDAGLEVLVNGHSVRRLKFDATALLAGDTVLPLDTAHLRAGKNKIELRRLSGHTPVYALALASAWARGDSVRPAGHLAEVFRTFERQKTHTTLAGTLSFTPEPLDSNGSATAGEQVTASVMLNLPHDLEYVMVEVPKPAGCEPLNPLSGWDARLIRATVLCPPAPFTADDEKALTQKEGRLIYREERDDKSVFFLERVGAGMWVIQFHLRAIHPGDYRALPVHAEAMYAPEVRANSDARRLRIEK